MSIIDQIENSNSVEKISQLIEEHVIDIESPLSWREEADILEKQGENTKAEILRAAEKRCIKLTHE